MSENVRFVGECALPGAQRKKYVESQEKDVLTLSVIFLNSFQEQ